MWYTDVRNQNQHWGKLLSTGCGCAAIRIDTGLEDRVIVAGSFGVYCGTTCRGNAVKNEHKPSYATILDRQIDAQKHSGGI